MERNYFEAYDDRYQQIHEQNLRWFSENPSPVVTQMIAEFKIEKSAEILEIGCGEGRDAMPLLEAGFDLLATDISSSAIAFCRKNHEKYTHRYQILDCLSQSLDRKFDFIYAVAVIHMLVLDEDRRKFYNFIRNHLSETGVALICTMGNGTDERESDISSAFDLQERIHEQTGKTVWIAGTSCKMVSFRTFRRELAENGLRIIKEGNTSIVPDFPEMLYAVVQCI